MGESEEARRGGGEDLCPHGRMAFPRPLAALFSSRAPLQCSTCEILTTGQHMLSQLTMLDTCPHMPARARTGPHVFSPLAPSGRLPRMKG